MTSIWSNEIIIGCEDLVHELSDVSISMHMWRNELIADYLLAHCWITDGSLLAICWLTADSLFTLTGRLIFIPFLVHSWFIFVVYNIYFCPFPVLFHVRQHRPDSISGLVLVQSERQAAGDRTEEVPAVRSRAFALLAPPRLRPLDRIHNSILCVASSGPTQLPMQMQPENCVSPHCISDMRRVRTNVMLVRICFVPSFPRLWYFL